MDADQLVRWFARTILCSVRNVLLLRCLAHLCFLLLLLFMALLRVFVNTRANGCRDKFGPRGRPRARHGASVRLLGVLPDGVHVPFASPLPFRLLLCSFLARALAS